jgi:CMP-N-acetylneuraminic acid synthetase
MKNKISVFLPTRKGSERVKNKNTRKFANVSGGLLELKLNQLANAKYIDEIVLSTNDEACIDIGILHANSNSKVKVIPRPDTLALSSTNLSDLIEYVPTICSYSHILWTHVTSPFFEGIDYDNAILEYFKSLKNGNDSLMSGKLFKNFLWDKDKNDLINRIDKIKWPRTQDLKKLYEIDSAIFITSKDIYINHRDRVGINPFIFENDSIKSMDVDWENDFLFAEMIYHKYYEKQD